MDISFIKVYKESIDYTLSDGFNEWFADSRVVDENGKPLKVYHGTSKSFDRFKAAGDGIFFTNKESTAKSFTGFEDLEINDIDRAIVDYPNITDFKFDTFKDWLDKNGFDIKQDQDEVYEHWEYHTVQGYRITRRSDNESTFIMAYAPHQVGLELRRLKSKSKARVISAYLKILNPIEKDLEGKSWSIKGGTLDIGQMVMDGDYDGAIIRNVREGDGSVCDVYIVADDNQIWQVP